MEGVSMLKSKLKNLTPLYAKYITHKNNLEIKKEIKRSQFTNKQMEDNLKFVYKNRTNQDLDWTNLERYTEKMQWAKLYDGSQLKTKLSDKYLVRQWIADKIGESYLIPLLGVWDSFEEINLENLPDQFVLKVNHSSGVNLIVKDKSQIDWKLQKVIFNNALQRNFGYTESLELHYKDIQPKIIAEEYIEDSSGQLNDYKFLCFGGKVYYCWVDFDRYDEHKRNIYNLDWELQDWNQYNYSNFEGSVPKPKNFELMVELAEILCEGFSHVRVDLYNVDGKIYFGEMTFTNGAGFEIIHPDEANLMLGDLWDLSFDKDN